MLYLKKINLEDADEEYRAIKMIPQNELKTKYYNISKEEFKNNVISRLLKNSEGIDLPNGYVPDTYFFLWNDKEIVGFFKIRHYLNDFLKKDYGHIGFYILPDYRNKGYATEGLKLAIKEAKKIIPEDEIYLSVPKNNIASLKVQQKCGAIIVNESEDGKKYLTRIQKRFDKQKHSLAVARKMAKIAKENNLGEEEIKNCFLIGYVHDIGYEFTKNASEHNKIGGEILKASGFKYWREVYYHGKLDAEYKSLYLDILNKADLQIDIYGNDIGYDARLEDIKVRYGEKSKTYEVCRKLVEKLR